MGGIIAHAQENLVSQYTPLAEGLEALGLGNIENLASFFEQIFELAILAGGVLAVLIIAAAGLQYMTTDAFRQKTDARERITFAVAGLLMLLGTWLFFNEINPSILDTNFELDGVSIGNEGPETGNGNGGGAASPGAGDAGARYRNPTWTTLSGEESCSDVYGGGWVRIDGRYCPGQAPGGSPTGCCARNPDYVRQAEFIVGQQVRIADPGFPDDNIPDGPFHNQLGIVAQVQFTQSGFPRYIIEFSGGQSGNFGHELVIRGDITQWCLWDDGFTCADVAADVGISAGAWCYFLDGGGANCYATSAACDSDANQDPAGTSSCEQL